MSHPTSAAVARIRELVSEASALKGVVDILETYGSLEQACSETESRLKGLRAAEAEEQAKLDKIEQECKARIAATEETVHSLEKKANEVVSKAASESASILDIARRDAIAKLDKAEAVKKDIEASVSQLTATRDELQAELDSLNERLTKARQTAAAILSGEG